jgi:alanyl-tRNA synthetase
MAERSEHVELLIREEEKAFGRTLDRGIVRFAELAGRVPKGGAIPGGEAYDLYATYGFPRTWSSSWRASAGSRSTSRLGRGARQAPGREPLGGRVPPAALGRAVSALPPTRSTYHEAHGAATSAESTVVGFFPGEGATPLCSPTALLRRVRRPGRRPRRIEALDGTFRFEVTDTQKMGSVVVHRGRAEGSAAPAWPCAREVDVERRQLTRKNHTATHLLHAALRAVLGEHVTQQGSYVGPDRCASTSRTRAPWRPRSSRRSSARQRRGRRQRQARDHVEDLAAAKARGVMALFGEKYEDRVRVVHVPGVSLELCGGTHVAAAGDIGLFVIVTEGAIQAGVRRIEALTARPPCASSRSSAACCAPRPSCSSRPGRRPARVEQLQQQVKDAKKVQKQSAKAGVATRSRPSRPSSPCTTACMRRGGARPRPGGPARPRHARQVALAGPGGGLARARGDKVPWIVCARRGAPARRHLAALVPLLQEHLAAAAAASPTWPRARARTPGRPRRARGVGRAPARTPG